MNNSKNNKGVGWCEE